MSTMPPKSSQALSHLELVRAAVLAPSPDNNQPWRFASRGEQLLVYLDPQDALPSDVNSMFDLMGLGAAIENAAIAARNRGYEAQVTCDLAPAASPQDSTLRAAATVRFEPGAQPDPLEAHLAARCTNRKLYSTDPPDESSLQRLRDAAASFSEVRLDWIADRPRICEFARIVKQSDRFRFEYRPFHKEIYRQLRFSAEEAERTGDGLDVRTMELPPGTGLLLRLLRPWPVMRFLNWSRLGRLLTLPSLLSVRRSGALGALSLPEPTPEGFLRGGQAFQRIWLAAQAEGLALQPLGSLAVFIGQMEQLGGRNLTAAHQRLSDRLGQWVRRLVPSIEDRTLLMLFRLGDASPPSVRALRRPAEVMPDVQKEKKP